jgi:predicted transcriptional regulator
MINEPYTEYLPQVRCTATMKARLERVAEGSVARNLADHIRAAIERYVAQEEARQQVAEPQQA